MINKVLKANDRLVLAVLLILMGKLIISNLFSVSPEKSVENQIYPESNETSKSKIILDWTGFFGSRMRGWTAQTKNECAPINDCFFTSDKSRFLDADLVIFHARDIDWADLPPFRKAQQRYLFHLYESAMYTENFNNYTGLNTSGRAFFNWTMTYRADSDFPIPSTNLFTPKTPNNTIMDGIDLLLPKKDKLIVWFGSNCITHSKRERYIKKLQQFVQVDIYGACGPFNCSKSESPEKCFNQLHYNYKFFIAFENSLCTDYITEKVGKTINYWSVPIVLNRELMNVFGWPEKSFIAVDDFASVRQLAEYLLFLDGNSKEYRKYFLWRTSFDSTARANEHFKKASWCHVCNRLHNENETTKVYEDILKWWAPGGICLNDFVFDFL